MKVKISRSQFILFLLLISTLFLFAVEASNNDLPLIELMGSNECNNCHGPSHRGHVSYTTTLNTPEILLNDTEAVVSVAVKNNDFPLSASSLTLQETADYSLVTGQQVKQDLGTVSRGESLTVEWSINVHVTTAKTITIQAEFSGTAIDHKTFVYTNQISKSIFVSTTPTPILKVVSDPPTGSTFYTGDQISGTLHVSNVGNLAMSNVEITTKGSVTVDGQTSATIPTLDPKEELTYELKFDTNQPVEDQISIKTVGNSTQEALIEISVQNPPPTPLSLIIGRVLGYLAYLTLFASVITGVARYPLRKKFSGRKLRILHADLSNMGFTLVVMHAISLVIPSSPWSSAYRWFQIIPSTIPTEITTVGLELGRWGLLIMYISVVSGYYFAKIVKRWGRSVGIRIHMLSYLALIGGMAHALAIGGTARNPIISLLFVLTILAVLIIKYDDRRRKQAKRDTRQARLKRPTPESKKRVSRQPPATITKEEQPSPQVVIATDMRTGKKRGIGVVCWYCLSLNDEDANYCKTCGKHLEGKICAECKTRNDSDAKFCKNCASPNFIEQKEDK